MNEWRHVHVISETPIELLLVDGCMEIRGGSLPKYAEELKWMSEDMYK